MSEARTFYAPLPQKLLMVLDRLMALGLVEPAPLVEWTLTSQPDLDQDQQDSPADGAQDQQDAPTAGAGEAGGDQAMGEAAAEGPKAGAKAVKAVDSWPSARWELLHYAIERCLLRSVELQQKITTQEELVGVLQAKVRVACEGMKMMITWGEAQGKEVGGKAERRCCLVRRTICELVAGEQGRGRGERQGDSKGGGETGREELVGGAAHICYTAASRAFLTHTLCTATSHAHLVHSSHRRLTR